MPLRRRNVAVPPLPFLVGAVLPDIPFFLLTVGGEAYYRWVAPLPQSTSIMEYLHFTLFFRDPLWIVSHNFFHSLVITATLLLVGVWGMRRTSRWGPWLFWMAVSMLLHIGIDVVTHQSDGPLIWFPLNWTYRFASPVSYWEPAYFGRSLMVAEYALDLALALFLVASHRQWLRAGWQRWFLPRTGTKPTHS